MVKSLLANTGNLRDLGSIPGWEDPLEVGHGNPLQYFRLENPMERGAWWATVHRVTKSGTQTCPTPSTQQELKKFLD